MSQLVVRVCTFTLKPHPKADRLLLAKPDGMEWRCCVQKGPIEEERLAVYIPIDSILPPALADFLEPVDHVKGEPHRVRTLRLRDFVSQGMLVRMGAIESFLDSQWNHKMPEGGHLAYGWAVGQEVAEMLGITKFVAPEIEGADTMGNPPGAINHTDIQSRNTFADAIPLGTPVVITEKLHGVAAKFGWMPDGSFMVGTNNATVKPGVSNLYTQAAERLNLAEKMRSYQGLQFFGELCGEGVQKRMHYGLKGTKDVFFYGAAVHGEYLDYDQEVNVLRALGLRAVPLLYRGPLTEEALALADGPAFAGGHIREGIVLRTERESYDDQIGRVIVKVVSKDYLSKNYDKDEVR